MSGAQRSWPIKSRYPRPVGCPHAHMSVREAAKKCTLRHRDDMLRGGQHPLH
jgi:hypothetical protein